MIQLRGAHFLTVFLIWVLFPVLGAAELPPYHKYEGPIKPGIVITKENWNQYLPELKKLLPATKLKWIGAGVTKGLVTMPIVKTTYLKTPMAKGFAEATKKYRGTAHIGPGNQLLGWKAGIPFPEPKTAIELAWNVNNNTSHIGALDDYEMLGWFSMFQGTKYEKHFSWHLYDRRYQGRTDIPPLGDMPEFTEKHIDFRESIVITEPQDVKGFINVRNRFTALDKPDESYAYIPAIRRLRRLTGADQTDPLLGSDSIPDDNDVMRQKFDSRMKFTVLEHRDFLMQRVVVLGVEKEPSYDYKKTGPCIQVEWELRPMYVMEIQINDPDYVYSKRVNYIDAVFPSINYWGEQYDQKGRLFRGSGPVAPIATTGGMRGNAFWIWINYQTDHFTVLDMNEVYMHQRDYTWKPLPESVFTIKGLMKGLN